MSTPTPSPFPVFDDVPEQLRRSSTVNNTGSIPLLNVYSKDGLKQIFYDEASDDFYYYDTNLLVPQADRKGFQTTLFRRKCMEVTITYGKPRHFKNGKEVDSLE